MIPYVPTPRLRALRCSFFLGLALVLGTSILGTSAGWAQSPRTHDFDVLAPGTVRLKGEPEQKGLLSVGRPAGQKLHLTFVGSDGSRSVVPVSNVKSFWHGERYVVNHGTVQPNGSVSEVLIVRHLQGRLDLYAPLEDRTPRFPYAYFSTEGGLIQRVNYANLRTALAHNSESAALLTASQRWRWTQYGLAASGTALTVTGLAQSFTIISRRPGPEAPAEQGVVFRPNAMLFTGLGIVALSFVPRALKKVKFHQAIRQYLR